MLVVFVEKDNGPERLVADAEIHFDEPGRLCGLKLIGLSLWKGADGELYVTFPSRSFGAGGERRYYDYLRPVSADGGMALVAGVKEWVLGAWRNQQAVKATANAVRGRA